MEHFENCMESVCTLGMSSQNVRVVRARFAVYVRVIFSRFKLANFTKANGCNR